MRKTRQLKRGKIKVAIKYVIKRTWNAILAAERYGIGGFRGKVLFQRKRAESKSLHSALACKRVANHLVRA